MTQVTRTSTAGSWSLRRGERWTAFFAVYPFNPIRSEMNLVGFTSNVLGLPFSGKLDEFVRYINHLACIGGVNHAIERSPVLLSSRGRLFFEFALYS